MSLQNFEYRFQVKSGKYVYIQTRDSVARGREIIRRVEKKYSPHEMFFHLERRGGHVAALKMHQKNLYFSRFDIESFFGQVTRTKVARALREIGFGHKAAFSFALDSVVVEGEKKILPYGFCQSPLLATLTLERSLFGGLTESFGGRGMVRVGLYG